MWEILARLMAGSFCLPGRSIVTIWIMDNAGLVTRALRATLQEAALGYVFGNLAGIGLAMLVMLLPRIEGLVQALALVVFCLPLVATGPILRVLYGPGIGPQVTLAALAVYYTTFVPLVVGLRAAPRPGSTWWTATDGARWTALVQVRALAIGALSAAGLQIAAPAAFLGAMVGEFTGAERGMGVLVDPRDARARRRRDLGACDHGVERLDRGLLGVVGWLGGLSGRTAPAAPVRRPGTDAEPWAPWRRAFRVGAVTRGWCWRCGGG